MNILETGGHQIEKLLRNENTYNAVVVVILKFFYR